MYVVHTSKEGPCAAVLTQVLGDQAVRNLRPAYFDIGERVWLAPARPVQLKDLEVLRTVEEIEVVVRHRVQCWKGEWTSQTKIMFRGQVRCGGLGDRRAVRGEGFSHAQAMSFAEARLELDPAAQEVAIVPFSLEDFLRPRVQLS
ncbi:hypothetical protein [Deinococcus sp. Leaf326]|uniref:hypothetical protein n=1 Tax=Deinococcus sp. Leaf326 TaxID=1736338 RepID=UPI001F2FFF0F|nr:hypothetical protein [Deinococcus sp. Leaf326]